LDRNRVKLGIAPIGWTNDDMPELGGENSFEQCVSEMALAGFTGSELGNKYPRDPRILKKALDLRGITICNAWFSSFLTTRPFEQTKRDFIRHIDFLYKVGARVVGAAEQGRSIQGRVDAPIFRDKPCFTDDEWSRLTKGLCALGRIANKKGMTLCYHHHMGTGVQTLEEIDRLMDATDPSLVSLLYDTGHLAFSGVDPLVVLRKYLKRIKHVHLKDIRKEILKKTKKKNWSFLQAVKEGVFTIPGDGMIAFDPIFKLLEEHGYAGWMVVEAEQDPARANPLEYAIRARGFIKDRTGL